MLFVCFEGFARAENHIEQPTTFSSIGQWLQSLGLSEFEKAFINFGYDDINFIVS